jgi:hypothetical protein
MNAIDLIRRVKLKDRIAMSELMGKYRAMLLNIARFWDVDETTW